MNAGSMFLATLFGAAVVATTVAGKRILKVSKQKITFQEYLEQISKIADEYMLKEEKKSGMQFIGGDCKICRFPETMDIVSVQMKIYSKDSDENWQTSTMEDKMPVTAFAEDEETQAKLEKLKTEALQMKVTVPDKEEN